MESGTEWKRWNRFSGKDAVRPRKSTFPCCQSSKHPALLSPEDVAPLYMYVESAIQRWGRYPVCSVNHTALPAHHHCRIRQFCYSNPFFHVPIVSVRFLPFPVVTCFTSYRYSPFCAPTFRSGSSTPLSLMVASITPFVSFCRCFVTLIHWYLLCLILIGPVKSIAFWTTRSGFLWHCNMMWSMWN